MDLLNIAEFRKQFEDAIQGKPISTFDRRDLSRLRSNDKYVLCFVNWKKGCINSAVNLALEVLKWRKEMKINDISVDNLDRELLRRGIVFVHGRALDSTRIVYFIVRLQTKSVKTTVQRILCLWLEKLHQQETGSHVTFVLDVSKATMSNVDLGSIKFLLDCFTTYFPDMLERIIILEMPWIMNAIWKIVKQWMSEDQRRKTVFCSFKDLKQYISPKNILTGMYGKDDWSYTFPPPIDEMPMLDTSAEVCCLYEGTQQQQDNDSENYTSVVDEDDYAPVSRECENVTVDNDVATDHAKSQYHSKHNVDDPYAELHSLNSLKNRQRSIVELKKHPEEPRKVHLNTPDMGFLQVGDRADRLYHNGYNFVNGVNLSSLLILSPASEVVFRKGNFDESSGKYESRFTLTNLNRGNQVAFKIKSNSPSHYLVKPNTGFVSPGDTVTIFLYLNAGFETAVSKDKFLILYQRKGDATSVKEFWRTHMPKHMRFEYRLTVRFSEKAERRKSLERSMERRRISPPRVFPPPPPIEGYVPKRTPSLDELSNFTESSTPDNESVTNVHTSRHPLRDGEMERLFKEVFSLKETLSTVDTTSKHMRQKLRFSLFLHGFVLFLLFYVTLKLSVLTSLLELGHAWQ